MDDVEMLHDEGEDGGASVWMVGHVPRGWLELSERLCAHGIAVDCADGGIEGLQRLHRGAAPDLIVLSGGSDPRGVLTRFRQLQADAGMAHVHVMLVVSPAAGSVEVFDAGAVDCDCVSEQAPPGELFARIRTQVQLARAQRRIARLEAAHHDLQALIRTVAHDLRSPLAAIDGFGSLLQDVLQQGARDARGLHYLSRIRSGVRQMDQLIEALLMLGRLSRHVLQREHVNLAAFARTALQRRAQQEPARRVRVEIQPDLHAYADPVLMAQAMDLLVDNAWKFTVSTPDAQITVGRLPQADGAFFVRDNGVGFDMAHADKLFKPFQRLHDAPEFPGLGVGLAMVHRIVTRHGGRLWAQADPQGGAMFCFTIGR